MPPTINHYYGNRGKGAKFIKPAGQLFRSDVAIAVQNGGFVDWFDGDDRLAISVVVSFARYGKADIDNRLKPLLDALEAARLFPNDSQVDELTIKRGKPVKGGLCEVFVGVTK